VENADVMERLPSPSTLRCLVAALAFVFASRAYAQDAPRAQALFDEGRRLMDEGHFAEACPKLAASQKLDPGAGTLMNLATCYESNGQLASAWATFKEAGAASRASGHADWETAARTRADQLEPKLPRLTVTVTGSGSVSGLVVERDGVALDPAEWGTATPIDVGKHVVRATAPGKTAWSSEVTIPGPSTLTELAVPPLGDEIAGPPAKDRSAPAPSGDGSALRVAGLVLAAGGIVALGAGAFFGLKAKSTHDDALSHCNAARQCDQSGVGLGDDASSQATVSTIAFIAGGALLIGGAVLFLSAPSPAPPPQVARATTRRARTKEGLRVTVGGPGLAGLSLRGAF
jgi:hypothetical protein